MRLNIRRTSDYQNKEKFWCHSLFHSEIFFYILKVFLCIGRRKMICWVKFNASLYSFKRIFKKLNQNICIFINFWANQIINVFCLLIKIMRKCEKALYILTLHPFKDVFQLYILMSLTSYVECFRWKWRLPPFLFGIIYCFDTFKQALLANILYSIKKFFCLNMH